ncbi:MAG: SDR family NAD(P)-dependent oxidoreductase [Acidobacteria bacterium]|nr:SDR family NAD(P)-dependent oxidoreductase [Acidobacteriota bacterium]MCA1609954.1 SDR family NAD(P)-dependent oxidoreductase [Acidobacteriota bacterium]
MNPESWKGRGVLITGGLGFIGSNLAIRLVREGARVTLCDAMIEGYGGNRANIREIASDASVVIADVRDEAAMGDLVADRDVVFHLAAQVSHVMSLSNPYPDIDINIKGTAAVLEACRKRNPDAVVVRSGTRGQYGPAVRLPVSEEAPSDPRGLYEISQLTAEMICRTYTRIHRIRTVPLRLTNVYGPRAQMRHSHFGVVNWFVRLALTGESIPIFGSGQILRDFLYVDDCVEALLKAAGEPSAVGEILNVGNDRSGTFLEVARILQDLVPGTEMRFTDFTPERRAQEPGDFVSDISKIRRMLGWSPRVDLRDGLARTVEFYRERREDYF